MGCWLLTNWLGALHVSTIRFHRPSALAEVFGGQGFEKVRDAAQ